MPTAKPMPSAARFFDDFADRFDSLYDGRRSAFMQWIDKRYRSDMFERFALSFQLLGNLSGHTVLDVGCGSGPYIIEALRRGADAATGVDPAATMLVLARSKLDKEGFSSKCTLIEGSFPGVELEPHDFAIVMGVMDYVENPGEFLRALRPLVRSRAVLSFPSRHWFRTPLRKVRYKIRRCPLFFYDSDQIHDLATAAGFGKITITKIDGAGMDYHVCLDP